MNEIEKDQESLPDFVKLYLDKYGLPGWRVETVKHKKYNNIVVIPAIQEYENILQLLASLSQIDDKYVEKSLLLFVINNSAIVNEDVKKDNLRTLSYLQNIVRSENPGDELSQKVIEKGFNIGFIDASSSENELPEKDAGVGLARKIGMDLALTLFDYKSSFKKILICLDADCTVEKNYLTTIVNEFNNKKISAGHVQYEHILPEDEIEKKAIICYEIFLRYYTLGLKFAQSPFAFTFIGSTMLCDAESYCRVGGMNKRKAAEDFYFLEKLAKVMTIRKVDSTKVCPASRPSWRVPFGTGQRINRFLSNSHEEYLLYNPKIFVILKKWFEVYNSEKNINEKELLLKAEEIDPQLFTFLKMNSFENNWIKIFKNSKTIEQINKQKIMWFDGFRTMKLVHYLRDNGYAQIQMFDALDEIFILMNIDRIIHRSQAVPEVETQIAYLDVLRKIT